MLPFFSKVFKYSLQQGDEEMCCAGPRSYCQNKKSHFSNLHNSSKDNGPLPEKIRPTNKD
jgi:hypothetical protein